MKSYIRNKIALGLWAVAIVVIALVAFAPVAKYSLPKNVQINTTIKDTL